MRDMQFITPAKDTSSRLIGVRACKMPTLQTNVTFSDLSAAFSNRDADFL